MVNVPATVPEIGMGAALAIVGGAVVVGPKSPTSNVVKQSPVPLECPKPATLKSPPTLSMIIRWPSAPAASITQPSVLSMTLHGSLKPAAATSALPAG